MNCNEATTLLDDWLDDTLPSGQRERMESHLSGCTGCRQHEAELRQLLARAASLPRSIEPAHDLWPGILDGIGGGKVLRPRFGWPAPPRRLLLQAAAVLFLVVASSGLTALFLRGGQPSAAPPSATTVAWQEFEAAEHEYQRVTDELLEALDGRRGELSDETITTVERNLALIDEAIREARTALEQDPSNAGLTNRLTDIYRKRVDFLQAMTRL